MLIRTIRDPRVRRRASRAHCSDCLPVRDTNVRLRWCGALPAIGPSRSARGAGRHALRRTHRATTMRNGSDDPSGKGVKMRREAAPEMTPGTFLWPLALVLALVVGYFIGASTTSGEAASESSQWRSWPLSERRPRFGRAIACRVQRRPSSLSRDGSRTALGDDVSPRTSAPLPRRSIAKAAWHHAERVHDSFGADSFLHRSLRTPFHAARASTDRRR